MYVKYSKAHHNKNYKNLGNTNTLKYVDKKLTRADQHTSALAVGFNRPFRLFNHIFLGKTN